MNDDDEKRKNDVKGYHRVHRIDYDSCTDIVCVVVSVDDVHVVDCMDNHHPPLPHTHHHSRPEAQYRYLAHRIHPLPVSSFVHS